jgi:hypothetical protein
MAANPRKPAPAKVRDLVEIRIHGVSGTSKTSLLEQADTIQVAGDKRSGFHRRRGWNAYGPADGVGQVGRVRRHLEAYSWGGLTSGSASRAAWLLLLPFALVNVAAWSHPAADGTTGGSPTAAHPWRGGRRHALLRSIRLLALTLTMTFVTTSAGIGMDLIGRQCIRNVDRCYAGHHNWFHSLLLWLGDRAPGTQLALSAVVPVAVVSLLWALAGRSYRTYEAGTPDGVENREEHVDGQNTPFALRGFWQSKSSMARLRSLHIATAFATIAALVARTQQSSPWTNGLTLAAVGVVVGCVALLLFSRTADLGDDLDGNQVAGWALGLPRVLRYLAKIILLAGLLTAFGNHELRSGTLLPGYSGALWSVTVVQFLSLIAIVVMTWATKPTDKPEPRPFLRGYLSPVLAALAIVTAAIFSSGAMYKMADLIAAPGGTSTLHPLFQGTSLASAVVAPILLLGLIAAAYAAARGYTRPPTFEDTCTEYGESPPRDAEVGKRLKVVARARYLASLTERGPAVLAGLAVCGIAVGAFSAYSAYTANRLDALLAGSLLGFDRKTLAGFGSTVVTLLLVGLVALGGLAYRKDSIRRSVGILWDLATFWPRAAHPLAPPCYCERTVPQLVTRITGLTEHGGAVLLSAHSQGSIIAAAALCQLPQERLSHVALLTHGSPLRRLYARAFPAYFTAELFALTRTRLTTSRMVRWRNCWRKTDYLGQWVFTKTDGNGVDVPVEDPPAHPKPDPPRDHAPLHPAWGDIVPPAPLRHSNYYVSYEYDREVQALDGLLGVAPGPDMSLLDNVPIMVGGPAPSPEDLVDAPQL